MSCCRHSPVPALLRCGKHQLDRGPVRHHCLHGLIASFFVLIVLAVVYVSVEDRGIDNVQVAKVIVTKSPEECQALYSRFKSYLSLPKGIQHQVAFLAMVKDMVESESKVRCLLNCWQCRTELHRACMQHPD